MCFTQQDITKKAQINKILPILEFKLGNNKEYCKKKVVCTKLGQVLLQKYLA